MVLVASAPLLGRFVEYERMRLFLGLADQLVVATEARIQAETQAGNSFVEDAHEVATALVWMNERYLLRCYGRTRDTDPDPGLLNSVDRCHRR